MKRLFTFWPEEVNKLPAEKKRKVIGGVISKSKKLQMTFFLIFALELIIVGGLAYFAIFVYQIDLERGSLESIYFTVGCLAICALSTFPLKIIARSEYFRLKSELLNNL